MVAVDGALTSRLAGFGTTIFAEMSALAVATDSMNLGQGFPDTDGPPAVLEAAIDAIRSGVNQYPPGIGRAGAANGDRRPPTRLVRHRRSTPTPRSSSRREPPKHSPERSSGCSTRGDEVVVFEPMYDSYQACIALADAVAVPVLLSPQADGTYGFDPDDLRGAVTPRTKLILLNTPHNPTGKVFDAAELSLGRLDRRSSTT